MDHQEAVSLGATERYLLGTLGDEQREAFEEHYFSCLECAEDLRAGMAVVAVARWLPESRPDALPHGSDVTPRQTPVITAAQAAELAVAPARGVELPEAREVSTSRAASRARRRWFGAPQVRGYALALSGLAAGLCVAAYQGIVVIARWKKACVLCRKPGWRGSSSVARPPPVTALRSIVSTFSPALPR